MATTLNTFHAPGSNTATAIAGPTWEKSQSLWCTRAGRPCGNTMAKEAPRSPRPSTTLWRRSPGECTARCAAPGRAARSSSIETPQGDR